MAAASLEPIDIIFIKRGGEDGAEGWLLLSTKDVFRSSGSGEPPVGAGSAPTGLSGSEKESDGPVLNVTPDQPFLSNRDYGFNSSTQRRC